MRVATFNAHDRRQPAARALELAQLVAWQEAPRKLEQVASARLCCTVRGGKGIAVTFPCTWRLQSASWHRAHAGRRLVSPARGTLRVDVELPGGVDLTVLCGHRVNGTGLDGRRRRPAWRWRRARWHEHAQLDEALLQRAVDVDGRRLVVLAMDGNRPGRHTPRPHPAASRLTPGAAIDQLWLVDLDGVVQRPGVTAHRIGSDHPLRLLSCRLLAPVRKARR